jgi:uncharacterized membrane protein
MLKSRLFRRAPLALAAALAFTMGTTACAQPGHGPGMGPRGHHGTQIVQVIASVMDRLGLDSSQQVMFDSALAATRTARENGRAEMQRMRGAAQAELAKPEPDLAALAAAGDAAQANLQAARRQVRAQWLQLYATFSPAQKGVVRDVLVQRMERHETFRAKMRERFGGQG